LTAASTTAPSRQKDDNTTSMRQIAVYVRILTAANRWLFSPRPFAHERRQRLHYRPTQIWADYSLSRTGQGFTGETLQRVDAA
jgi:hypothetical protein